jgi:hypothetical protein
MSNIYSHLFHIIYLVSSTKAHFTLGIRAEKTWGQLWTICGLLFGPKLLINAKNIDVMILINASYHLVGHDHKGNYIGYPMNLDQDVEYYL